ncbi:DUF3710 domain-containing protein [Streptomyces sp. AD16]|nr:DUF3710 domain-containing protein [Streptomyces sp. AD16]
MRAQVPVQLPDGKSGYQVVRFVGVDGPRWFLRGVISGQGAVQPQAAGLLEQIFQDTVVVRGEGRWPPRPDRPEASRRRPDGARGRPAGEPADLPLLRRHGPARARPGDHRDPLTAPHHPHRRRTGRTLVRGAARRVAAPPSLFPVMAARG